jgi:hypothetical protein
MDVHALEGTLADASRVEAGLEPFRRLLHPEFVRAFVDRDLRALGAGSGFATGKARVGHLRIHDAADLDVRACAVACEPPPDNVPVVMLTRHTLVGNAGPSPFVVRRWHQPEAPPNDVFDGRKPLAAPVDHMLRPREAVALYAGADAFALVGIERPGVALTAAGPHVLPFAWHYDPASRRPLRLTPVRKDWLYLQELLRFAEVAGDASLGTALTGLCAHPSHFVRWSAANAARRVAPRAGRDALRALANDPHRQLRAAVQLILAEEPSA